MPSLVVSTRDRRATRDAAASGQTRAESNRPVCPVPDLTLFAEFRSGPAGRDGGITRLKQRTWRSGRSKASRPRKQRLNKAAPERGRPARSLFLRLLFPAMSFESGRGRRAGTPALLGQPRAVRWPMASTAAVASEGWFVRARPVHSWISLAASRMSDCICGWSRSRTLAALASNRLASALISLTVSGGILSCATCLLRWSGSARRQRPGNRTFS
jgi:hypothetical protein